jgi:class 3 adenylate cyclase
MRRNRLRTALFLIVGAASVLIALALYLAPRWNPVKSAFESTTVLEDKSIDARFKIRGEKKPPDDVVVVAIDDATFQDLQQRWPFRRGYHAKVINRLRQDGAKLIVFDVQFTEPQDTGNPNQDARDDNALLTACARAGNCVMSSTEFNSKGQSAVFGGPPGQKFAKTKVGNGNVLPDSDGVLRHMFYERQKANALGIAAYERLTKKQVEQSALGVAALYTVATQVAFNDGAVLSYTYPIGSLVLSSVGSLAVHYVTEAFERARVRENFARFVPESVVGEVLEQADGARLGGVGRYATVMFSDLRGFTSFAEQLEPDQVIRILNRYLTAMVDDAILVHGGTLVDYMGDGIMAVFGAPIEMSDHADRALAAARDKLEQLEEFNDWMHKEYGFDKSFRMGIGLNSGQVMSGNVGSETRLAYTAIGDTTNTAARLEGMTKGTDYMLFMAESTREALSTEPADIAFVGEYEIRGRVEKLSIWSVEGSRKEKEEGGSFASVAQTETLADK